MDSALAYTHDERQLIACPGCGSAELVCMLGAEFDVCCSCGRYWERVDAGEAYTVDGEQLAFKRPCSSCAFRGGSPERADAARWANLMTSLAHGGSFYCHKAVPILEVPAAGQPMKFDFPMKADGAHIWDTGNMRLCRGYLNQFISPLLRQAQLESSGATK